MLHPFSFDIFGVLVGFCYILIGRFDRMSLFKFATGDSSRMPKFRLICLRFGFAMSFCKANRRYKTLCV